jgi:asparagine synthase (glutamine-hydrolysing)
MVTNSWAPNAETGCWIAAYGEAVAVAPGIDAKVFLGPNGGGGKILRLAVKPGSSYPAVAQGNSCAVIFDGILYNRGELSKVLGDPLSPDGGPAELILRAYSLWGEDIASRVNGIFALIVWDSRRDELLCVRDPLGLHPMFYACSGSTLLLSPSVEALVHHPEVSSEVNREMLAEHLCHRWLRQEETYYKHVRRVPPGHALHLSKEGRRVYRYWEPLISDNGKGWISEDRLEEFDQLVDQAVTRCLGIGRAGIFLSGGLDSVSVAAIASDNCRRGDLPVPLALSLGFPPPANEDEAQRAVARSLDIPQILLSIDEAVGPMGLLNSALAMSAERPAPLLNLWAPAYHHLGLRGREEGCAIVLTGNGGDEWLTVCPELAADLMIQLDIPGLLQFVRSFQRSYRLGIAELARILLWTYGARPVLGAMAAKVLGGGSPRTLAAVRRHRAASRFANSTPAWVAPDAGLRKELRQRYEENVSQAHPAGFYLSGMRDTLDSCIVAMELEEFFESGRRMGLLMHHPFWDAQLVDFLYRTPPQLLNSGGRSKGLVRQTLDRRFPRLGFKQHKKLGATSFFTSVVLSEGAVAWERIGGAKALTRLGIVSDDVVQEIASLFRGKRSLDSYFMWYLLSLEVWLRARL